MIKPANQPFEDNHNLQLTAAKPRSGLSKISELLPRLIRSYELQAEAVSRREQGSVRRQPPVRSPQTQITCVPEVTQQTTFAWFENS